MEILRQMNQLTLALGLSDRLDFESFCAGSNALLVDILKDMASDKGEHLVFVWGAKGVGRTHLLNALCNQASHHKKLSVYLPLSELQLHSPSVLAEISHIPIICLDDLHSIGGDKLWEEAIFSLYNEMRDKGGRLVISANSVPHRLPIVLQDLISRIQAMLVFEVLALTDEQKTGALQAYALHKSFELSDEVAQFILTRGQRDMSTLVQIIKKLERDSLSNHRKITIPFVKDMMGW